MELFTFIFEFNGGSYVHQVEAPSWQEAPRVWAKALSGMTGWTEADAADMEHALADDLSGPVPIRETVGTYAFWPEVRGSVWVATYVRTVPAGA